MQGSYSAYSACCNMQTLNMQDMSNNMLYYAAVCKSICKICNKICNKIVQSGFLPPTMSYVTYDVVFHARTTSYVAEADASLERPRNILSYLMETRCASTSPISALTEPSPPTCTSMGFTCPQQPWRPIHNLPSSCAIRASRATAGEEYLSAE